MQRNLEIEQLLDTLREVVSRISKQVDFDITWQKAVESFNLWLSSLPAEVSPFTRNLQLLRVVCDTFQEQEIRKNETIVQIIAEGAVESGEHVNLMGSRFRVISREITDQFGIQYTLENNKGEIIQREFFD